MSQSRPSRFVRRHWALIRASRAPLIIALLAYWGMSSPPQVRELYLLLASDPQRLLPQILLAAAAVIVLSFLIAALTRSLTSGMDGEDGAGFLQRLLPALLGALPLAGVAVGTYRALQSVLTPTLKQAVDTISALSSEATIASAVQVLKSQAYAPVTEVPTPEALANIRTLITSIVSPTLLELPQWTQQISMRIYAVILSACSWRRCCLSHSCGGDQPSRHLSARRFFIPP